MASTKYRKPIPSFLILEVDKVLRIFDYLKQLKAIKTKYEWKLKTVYKTILKMDPTEFTKLTINKHRQFYQITLIEILMTPSV